MQNPKTDEEKRHFYETTPFYIFELLWWHMTRYQKNFRVKVLELAQGSVLDFGGGPGDLSVALAKQGLKVTYADVEGRTFEFAKWLFQRNGVTIPMTNLSKEKVQGNYDTIICIDVIEHLPKAKEALKELALRLNSGGKLIVTNLVVGDESLLNHPMHEKVNLDDPVFLSSIGLKKTDTSWLLTKQ